jgi:hypothetical protein
LYTHGVHPLFFLVFFPLRFLFYLAIAEYPPTHHYWLPKQERGRNELSWLPSLQPDLALGLGYNRRCSADPQPAISTINLNSSAPTPPLFLSIPPLAHPYTKVSWATTANMKSWTSEPVPGLESSRRPKVTINTKGFFYLVVVLFLLVISLLDALGQLGNWLFGWGTDWRAGEKVDGGSEWSWDEVSLI